MPRDGVVTVILSITNKNCSDITFMLVCCYGWYCFCYTRQREYVIGSFYFLFIYSFVCLPNGIFLLKMVFLSFFVVPVDVF